MKKNYICISCPVGCHLELAETDGNIVITGNKCPRGEVYAREEFLSPKRIVTATCKTGLSGHRRLPVKTDKPVLKGDIDGLLKEIYKLKINSPVKCGDILIADYKNTGINVVATRSIT